MSVTMCKSIWLHVAASGALTSAEIADNFPCYQHVCQKLQEMWKAGMLDRSPVSSGPSRFVYSVTKDCTLPRGVKLGEALELTP